jgi:hypothetical protein
MSMSTRFPEIIEDNLEIIVATFFSGPNLIPIVILYNHACVKNQLDSLFSIPPNSALQNP